MGGGRDDEEGGVTLLQAAKRGAGLDRLERVESGASEVSVASVESAGGMSVASVQL